MSDTTSTPSSGPPSGSGTPEPDRLAPSAGGGLLSADDVYLFNEGSHTRLYRKMGAHPVEANAGESTQRGFRFSVWAPNAERVSVAGDFNGWDPATHVLEPVGDSGIWSGVVPEAGDGARYKYRVVSRRGETRVDKADPFAFHAQIPPETASVTCTLDYDWNDADWMEGRAKRNRADAPWSVYEMHLGSWRRPEDEREFLSYRELAPALGDYLEEMGFTHVELLPVMEHPFYGSWGYQTTGYFAPTSRYGSPQDFMYLVDHLHGRGIGVILDWVPSHFPTDEHGLGYFDGTHLYEHADPREGFHPDWNSLIFNYGRHEVRSFLLSSALFWLDVYHVDGLRVDAVASMLYRDYSREEGEWIPNEHGGRENLEAIGFLRRLNEEVYGSHPDVQMIAEESTAWPMVSRPTYLGGLGFGMKWDMGWMHDTLLYLSREPVHRSYHHNEITFRMVYSFNENFMLPLSHDEVVHGKGALLEKMPGDDWRKFAGLRVLLGYMYAQPGKKLLFMGGEFGQRAEWNHDRALDWGLLEHASHRGVSRWTRDLNRLLRAEPALHDRDFENDGFEWVEANDDARSVLAFLRKDRNGEAILAVFNLTPEPRENYRVGVSRGGLWTEVLNSDATEYGGSGWGNLGAVEAAPVPFHGRFHSLNLHLSPLGCVFLKAPSPGTATAKEDSDGMPVRSAPTEGRSSRRPGSAPRASGSASRPSGGDPSAAREGRDEPSDSGRPGSPPDGEMEP